MEKCFECGKELVPDGIAAGYGIDRENHKICYECCGKHDSKELENLGKGETMCLYFSVSRNEVSNWPGSLSIRPTRVSKGRHNIARIRYDVWFAHKGKNFHGVRYGEDSEILYIKALKEKENKK